MIFFAVPSVALCAANAEAGRSAQNCSRVTHTTSESPLATHQQQQRHPNIHSLYCCAALRCAALRCALCREYAIVFSLFFVSRFSRGCRRRIGNKVANARRVVQRGGDETRCRTKKPSPPLRSALSAVVVLRDMHAFVHGYRFRTFSTLLPSSHPLTARRRYQTTPVLWHVLVLPSQLSAIYHLPPPTTIRRRENEKEDQYG